MKDTNYAFCVAKIRANEKYLLNSSDINKLIECESYEDAVKYLSSKGWIEQNGDLSFYISNQNKKLWKLLSESVPDKSELDVLCILNDYFNIKAAVKCHLTSFDAHDFYVYPTTIDLQKLTDSVNKHRFDKLGSVKGETALKAYTVANKTENGQNAEIIIDKAAINCMCEYAQKKRNQLMSEICEFLCDTSNIKIALRCAITNKSKDFIESAIGDCVKLERNALVKKTIQGSDVLKEYLLKSNYKNGVELFLINPSAYDKWCDDTVIEIAKKAKFTSFGFAPVCAYYYAKINEIKTVNIILSGLLYSADKNTIKERVRVLYV